MPEGVPTSRRQVKGHQRNGPLERRRLDQDALSPSYPSDLLRAGRGLDGARGWTPLKK